LHSPTDDGINFAPCASAMARKLRYVPEGGALVEVTCRTVQSRFLLRPSPELNEIILGVLGRAQRFYPLDIVAHVFLSNHFHLLLWVPDAQRLAKFMEYVSGNLAREIARMTGWTDKIWSRRYQAIVVSDEEAAQVSRLVYLLSHGVKEHLVSRVADWPGIHCATSLLSDASLQGAWFNRTLEYNARLRREEFEVRKYTSPETVILSQLPCWKHLSPESYRSRIAQLVEEIEGQARQEREAQGIQPLGPKAILAQDPQDRPGEPKKSPAPLFHAFKKEIRKAMWEAYSWFVAAFQEAAEKLRGGDRNARFPIGSFPPHLPFVSNEST
jgi:REP element-mobilizing transposase RayT